MSHLLKFGIAAALAIVAGVGNQVYLATRSKPELFVAAKTPIGGGTPIELQNLRGVPLPGDYDKLKATFIPYKEEEMGFLVGMRPSRKYAEGDLILRQDLEKLPPRVLGPFTLLSVGDRVRVGSGPRYTEGRAGNSLTVLVDVDAQGNFDEATDWLLQVIASQSARDRNTADPNLRIISVMLYPKRADAAGAEKATSEAESDATETEADMSEVPALGEEELSEETEGLPIGPNQRAIFVPLQNVESVPAVLVRGDQVGFVLAR